MHSIRALFPITLSTLTCATLCAQVIPEVEPNDSASQAQFVACSHHIEATGAVVGDLDYYSFTLATPARVLVMVTTGPDGAVFDTEMELRDSNLNLVAYNDDDDRSWLSLIQEHLPAGTYYVMVKGFGNNTGAYGLDIQCNPGGSPPVRVPEGAEPNGPIGTGTPTTLGLDRVGNGDLTLGDTDWWSFTLTAPTVCRVETGKGLRGTTSTDTIMYLRDSTGNQLAFDDDAAPGNWSQIIATLQPGTYYADVQGFNGTNVGTYTVVVHTLDATNALTEGPEPNDDPRLGGAPTQLACGLLGQGDITAGDVDWWRFAVSGGAFVDLRTYGGALNANVSPLVNTRIRLYDASSNLLADDDNDFYNVHARLSVWLPTGIYYAAVSANNATGAGSYALQLNCDENALYHNFTGGCRGSSGNPPRYNVREWELPLVGTTLVGEFSGCPANGAIAPFFGFSRTITSTGLPLPVDLGVIGATGCVLEVDPLVVQGRVANAQGNANWAVTIPQNNSLAGLVISQQAIVLDPAANALGLTLTNSGQGLIRTVR